MNEPIEKKLTARLQKIETEFVFFELTIYDPSIAGEMILPYRQFVEFMHEQNVELITESEEDRVLLMKLQEGLARHELSL